MRRQGRRAVTTKTVRSAGGVVLRNAGNGLEVLLIATHHQQRWTLPKGRIESDESSRAAAVREVKEETGIVARVLAPLDTVDYWFYASRTLRFHKFVEYFLMEYQNGEPEPQLSEVDDALWFAYDVGLVMVAYANDRRLLQMARQRWRKAA